MREISGSFRFELPTDDILDTTDAAPQTGKGVTGDEGGFEVVADAVLDTTAASPQTGKSPARVDFDVPSEAVLDTTDASPQTSKGVTGEGN